ncbi:glycosyltransferase family 4 protein [Leptospira vanthielii]|uniref:Glycosyltransferase, group 1 family protein n=1 Tax=Leptospira vanthielii serovar Holland str. Waz Holland = ATCC 700522 TaxID=1218591 RepID=N1W857_9LEPT|nr:glycosyltransferase family 1 protein [Leptospira vanthielii]EMY69615.1 glycosyltransferase, group 1 family protein [Leptospira vanthielii serovar Holland str. Waz Holland = ATCC 700522]
MILGIDASNLRQGGGVTHIVEILKEARPQNYGFSKVCIWSNQKTLERITNRDWLEKIYQPVLDQSLIKRQIWQKTTLPRQLKEYNCDILYVPGGSDGSGFQPMVTMCRNMLPFEWKELLRYKLSWMSLKLLLVRISQLRSFRQAYGLIFLTDYARKSLIPIIALENLNEKVIPHGIDDRFFIKPRTSYNIERYTPENPFKILYVSIIDVYKHQVNVVKAVKSLIAKGYPIQLQLVGPAYKPELKRLRRELISGDQKIQYLGAIDYNQLHAIYKDSHLNVFASSCENMPNILLEGMASGLPIACSNFGPMPEILGDAGIYFHPEKVEEIQKSIEILILDLNLRERLSHSSYEKAKQYSWKKTADQTFKFLQSVGNHYYERRILNSNS